MAFIQLGISLAIALAATTDAHAQGKPRVAVTAFENKVKTPWGDPSWRIGEGLAEMLTSELARTGRFIVLERQGLSDVVGEQALGQSGLVRRESAAASGQLLGAQLIVRGAVTEFAERTSGGGIGVQMPDVAVQGQIENAHVAIDLRLIDATTGQVLASQSVAKRVPARGAAIGARSGNVLFGGDLFMQAPIGQASRAAIADAVQFVAARAVAVGPTGPPSFAIVKVEGSAAFINAGSNANVRVGDVFQVYTRGEALTDPDSGLKLGAAERLVGSVQISEVQEQFSIGTIRSGATAMNRGDRVRVK